MIQNTSLNFSSSLHFKKNLSLRTVLKTRKKVQKHSQYYHTLIDNRNFKLEQLQFTIIAKNI